MSEHQKETAFLQRCLGCADSVEHQALDQRITQLQRDERCVRRAVWLMAVMMVLAVAGLGYAAIMIEDFPQDTSHPMIKIAGTLGLTSIICLVAFAGLRVVYHFRLNQRREEGRQLVTRLLESHLSRPGTPPWRKDPFGDGHRETVQFATGRDLPRENDEMPAGI